LGSFLIGYPLLMTIVAICLFMVEFNRTGNVESARTWAFLSIIFFELYQAFAARSTLFPSIKVGLFKNRALLGAILFSFIVAFAAVYLPLLNRLFGTSPLTILEFFTVLILSSVGFIYLEISKHLQSKRLALSVD
jgi:Ca2+-transporting ATPase